MAERIVNIGLGGFAGPPGLTGPQGPPGESPFSLPDEEGTSTIASTVRRVDSYHASQAVAHIAGNGMSQQIMIHKLGPRASRVLLQFFFADYIEGLVQTIDAAVIITFNGTDHIAYDSGTPVVDDSGALGGTYFVQCDVYEDQPVLDIQVTSASPYISCHLYEIW